MHSILMAVDDGIANANYNWADVFFIVGTILAVVAGLAYVTGNTTTVDNSPPRYHYHAWAPALVAFAVACIAFAWFLL
jgi:hypothetical protein